METSPSNRGSTLHDIPEFLDLLEALAAVAANSRPVFLLAKRGTGPLFLAETIHRASIRASRKFAVVRCGLSPPSVVDSQLFGSRPSTRRNSGRFSGKIFDSDGGTLFVEQVQNASTEAQRALFQLLEDHEFTAGGVTRAIDLRIIVSASEVLEKYVMQKHFRMDLFYRLNGMPILVPPAARNREDIFRIMAAAKTPAPAVDLPVAQRDPHATREFLSSWRRLTIAVRNAQDSLGAGGSQEELLVRTLTELRRLPTATPRQLESLVMGAAIQCAKGLSHFAASTYEALTVEFQRALIRRALAESNGMLNCAAAMLGMTISELTLLLDNMGLAHDAVQVRPAQIVHE